MTQLPGTPKSLMEAMGNALNRPDISNQFPLMAKEMKGHLQDYIAQKFTAAIYKAETEAESQRLMALFREIIK